jgi:hypothetical protein
MVKSAKTTARQRAEQARLVRERAAARARRVRTAWWAIAAAPAFVVLLLIIKVATPGPGGGSTAVANSGPLSATTQAGLAPGASTLDTAGRGQNVTFPRKVDGQPALTQDNKPKVLYVGAEYCPFCASQRWPLTIALSRFGTFTGLTNTHSGSQDVFPNTPTVSFHGATYTSQFLVFNGVELNTNQRQGNGYAPLDTLTPDQAQLVNTYDAPPYTDQAGAVPFVDFGNQFLQTGASYSPQLLAGLTQDQVASAILNDPSGQVAQAILGAANAFTGILCKLTGGQPGDVCTSAAAKAYQKEVGGA